VAAGVVMLLEGRILAHFGPGVRSILETVCQALGG
jgi:hypothetical protein